MDSPPVAAENDEFSHFRRLMAFETRRAWDYYAAADRLVTSAERPDVCAAEIMRAIYADVLQRIERRNYAVLQARVRVPAPRKVWLAAKTWWNCR